MPASPKPLAASRPNPLAPAIARRRLEQGIQGIRLAILNLMLSTSEKAALEDILTTSQRLLESLGKSQGAPKKAAAKVAPPPKKPKPREAPLKTKKKLAAERERRIKMLEAKRKAEIEAVHRKSGFSTFVRRVPGSFEGGKK